jgi:hypothetical protein
MKEIFMKTLAFFALSVIATAAMAVTPVADTITINGQSTQITVLGSSGVSNTAKQNTSALQNLASNSGNVTVNGGAKSTQVVVAKDSGFVNRARGQDAFANQNVSSNMGDVTIGGNSLQLTAVHNAGVINTADGRNAKAVQNIASNDSCSGCLSRKGTGMYGD